MTQDEAAAFAYDLGERMVQAIADAIPAELPDDIAEGVAVVVAGNIAGTLAARSAVPALFLETVRQAAADIVRASRGLPMVGPRL